MSLFLVSDVNQLESTLLVFPGFDIKFTDGSGLARYASVAITRMIERLRRLLVEERSL